MRGLAVDNNAFVIHNDLPMPEPAEGQVLVRVVSATLNPDDPGIAAGHYDGFFTSKGHPVRTGFEFSGVVAQSTQGFSQGDRVYGYIDILAGGPWAHQEFLVIDANCIAPMPTTLGFDEAACVPMAAQTVLEGLRDVAGLAAGERLLVVGAAGGLGIFGVQLGKVLQAHVTAVAGPGQHDFLTGLGADAVIDYHATPLSEVSETFDVILDLSTHYRHADIAHLLTSKGRFVPLNPFKNEGDFAEGSEAAAATLRLMVVVGRRPDLERVASWIDAGDIAVHP